MMWWSALSRLMLPPGGLLVLALLGLLLWRRPAGRAMVALAIIGLYALSTPLASMALADGLEQTPALSPELTTVPDADAIVVLGGGRQPDAPEYGGDTVNLWTLERIRYAARLHLAFGLPVLVSGGTPEPGMAPEAALMANALEQDFGVPVRWVEPHSRNTQENARYATQMLRSEGVEGIILVTMAMHMPRSLGAFARAGDLRVTPAPTGFMGKKSAAPPSVPASLLPDRYSLLRSSMALHEYIGRLWYALHYR